MTENASNPGNTPISDEARRRELIETLTRRWRPYEGRPMYQADKLATEAVNVILREVTSLLVSAEAERVAEIISDELLAKWRSASNAARKSGHHFPADCLAEAVAVVEGLRAQLAETVPLAQHVEAQEALGMARTTIAELRAALRAAGGQEKPTAPSDEVLLPGHYDGDGCTFPSEGRHFRIAPVGGQAEPSDAMIEAAAKADYGNFGPTQLIGRTPWEELDDLDRVDWLTDARIVLRAALAAAVSGEPTTCIHGRVGECSLCTADLARISGDS